MVANRYLLWSLVAVFALRVVVLAILAPDRPDARNFVNAGHDLLFQRWHLYLLSARALAETGTLPVPGKGFLYPPAAAFLAAPFALAPGGWGPLVWTCADAVALLGGLYLIYSVARPAGAAKPLFWLLAAYFPPLFAEVDAGQIGGFILLLAAASIKLVRTRPLLAGVLAGAAAAVKVYPAGMLAGALPRWRYWAGLAAAALVTTVATFVPLGWSGAEYYLRAVFVPATLQAKYQDCAINSVKTLYTRSLGGDPYHLPGPHGLLTVQGPLHLPWLAGALAALTVAGFVLAAVWAARRSGWDPVYGLAVGFALGAVVPAEVNPYQFLPLLPLSLLVLVRSFEARRYWVPVLLGAGLLGFIRPPCDLPFPNLWTLGGVAMYLVGISQASLFSQGGGIDGSQPGHPVHMGRARDVAGQERAG